MLVRILALLFGALGFILLFVSRFVWGANKWGAWLVGLVSSFFCLYGLFGPRLLSKVAPRLVDRGESRESILAALERLPSLSFSQLLLININRTMHNPLLIIPIVLASVAIAGYCHILFDLPQDLQIATMPLMWMASNFSMVTIMAFLKTLNQRQRRAQTKDVRS